MNNSTRNRLMHWHLLSAAVVLVFCGSAALGVTYSIPGDTIIGTWDSVSRVYTLTGDVSGSIVVQENDLTLDGAGHTVTGAGSGIGIFLYPRTGVTVANVTVQEFGEGIYLASSHGNTLTCNTLTLNSYGIVLDDSRNNVLNGNVVSWHSTSGAEGIKLQNNASDNTVTGNTISYNDQGIVLTASSLNNQFSNNNFISNGVQAADSSSGNVFNLNHWSNWTSPDIDENGIVDNPYSSDGVEDPLPRVEPVPSTCGVLEVDIDIKPGSYPNAINLGSNGVIPVAILSSAEFDATTVDADTVALAGAGVAVRGKGSKLMAHEEDVNADGLVDLVVQVDTENLDPGSLQDGYAVLTGSTSGGQDITGEDEITIVPPQ